jgi:hypothetical protein
MRLRTRTWLALLVAALAPVLTRAADTPTVVVRINAIDNLVAELRYLIEMAGKTEEAKQIEGVLKSVIGDKGLEGLDTKKPLGLYIKVAPKFEDSVAVVLVPITDQDAVLDYIKRFQLNPVKEQDLYKLAVPLSREAIYFRFANKYAYITVRNASVIAKANLLDPETVLASDTGEVIALTANADQVPKTYKELVLGQIAQNLRIVKQQKLPAEVAELKGLRDAAVDEVAGQLGSLINDTSKIQASLKVDRARADLSASMTLTPKPGSKLADNIAELGKAPSVAASLIGDSSAGSAMLHLTLPASIRKALDPVIDLGSSKVLDHVPDNEHRGLVKMLLDGLTPTVKAGELDVGIGLAGPSAEGQYTVVLGGRVKEGAGIEKAIKSIVRKIPQAQDHIKLDADKAGSVNIHKITPDDFDPKAKKMLGDDTIRLAVRDDALVLTVGVQSDRTIKTLTSAAPRAGNTLQVDVAVSRIAPLMADEQKNAPAAAKKAFPDGKDDTLRLTVGGGQAFSIRLSGKAQLIKFATILDEMNKKGS